MNKRLAKRHKRQVARAKERVKLSEPDVRTPEQLAAAREASRAVSGLRRAPYAYYSAPSSNLAGPSADSPANVDTGSCFTPNSGCSPRAVPIVDPSILEVSAPEMPSRRLSYGFFNPTGAPFAVTASSCSVGKFPSGVRRKTGRAADAAQPGPANRKPCQSGGEFARTRRMGLPKAVSFACRYSAHFFFRAATMRRCASSLSILRLGICI